eukprot:16444080-Heterocapsa_arctica.AAC.1
MEADRETFLALFLAAGYDADQAVKLMQQPKCQPDEDKSFTTPETTNRMAGSPLSAPDNVSMKASSPRPVSYSLEKWFKRSPGPWFK